MTIYNGFWIFLKYVPDRLGAKYYQLVAENDEVKKEKGVYAEDKENANDN